LIAFQPLYTAFLSKSTNFPRTAEGITGKTGLRPKAVYINAPDLLIAQIRGAIINGQLALLQ
jgi:hypothetical protein